VPGRTGQTINKPRHPRCYDLDERWRVCISRFPVGTLVVVSAQGFPTLTVDDVPVAQGAIYTLQAILKISQQATTVEVSAAL